MNIDQINIGELLSQPQDAWGKKSCCAALYSLEPVRLLLGDTLHPGGLALTHRLGKLVGIQHDDLVLDLACGWGVSAMAVARSFHCKLVGLDLGAEAVAHATTAAAQSRKSDSVFLQGDGELLPFADDSFDVVLSECALSTFPDKDRTVADIARVLKPGGRLAMSDVTVEPGSLPAEFRGMAGQMLCVADALSLEGYQDLLKGAGLTLIHQQDASDAILQLLDDIQGKLAMFRMFQGAQPSDALNGDLIAQALPVIEKARDLVTAGSIEYWLLVAEKGTQLAGPCV